MSVPGNAEAIRGQGGSCLRVFCSSVSPAPGSRASNGFGISAVHFLEGVNYLVDEHICQPAEGAASVTCPREQAASWPDLGPLPALRRLCRARGDPQDGDVTLPAGAVPRLPLLAWPAALRAVGPSLRRKFGLLMAMNNR